jgi:hypothetical protein
VVRHPLVARIVEAYDDARADERAERMANRAELTLSLQFADASHPPAAPRWRAGSAPRWSRTPSWRCASSTPRKAAR